MRAIVLVLLLLSGCATAPTPQELAGFDYGPRPDRSDGVAMIEARIKSTLKDPDSARFTWPNDFRSGWYQRPFGQRYFGWITCGTVNAKNSYGGYVGQSAAVGVIRNGAVIETNVDPGGPGSFVADACRKLGAPAY